MVTVVAGLTAANHRGEHLCVSIASESAASDARWPRGLATVAVAAGGENVGEKSREKGACAWKTSTDDSHVTFDGGPFCCADIVVCIDLLDIKLLGLHF